VNRHVKIHRGALEIMMFKSLEEMPSMQIWRLMLSVRLLGPWTLHWHRLLHVLVYHKIN